MTQTAARHGMRPVLALVILALLAGCAAPAPDAPVPFEGFERTHAFDGGTENHVFQVDNAVAARFAVRFTSDPSTGARACNTVTDERPTVTLLDPQENVRQTWGLESASVNVGDGSCGQWEERQTLEPGQWTLRFEGRGLVAAVVALSEA